MDGFWGRSPGSAPMTIRSRAGLLQLVCRCRRRDPGRARSTPHVHYFYQKCLNVWEGFAEAPGYSHRPRRCRADSRAGRRGGATGPPVARLGPVRGTRGTSSRGQPADVRQQLSPNASGPCARGPPDGAASRSQHAEGADAQEHRAVSRRRSCRTFATSGPATRTLVPSAPGTVGVRASSGAEPPDAGRSPRRDPRGTVIFRVLAAGRGAPLVYFHSYTSGAVGRRSSTSWPGRSACTRRLIRGSRARPASRRSTISSTLTLAYDELLGALGLERPYLVGHSFADMAAAEIAAVFPGARGVLTLVSPSASGATTLRRPTS